MAVHDRYVDLRVDDHPEPVRELRRLLTLQLRFRRQERAFRLYDKKQYQAAARLFAEIVREAPDDATVRYNYACMLTWQVAPRQRCASCVARWS